MKSFPECLNLSRRCVWVGLTSVEGRGKKNSCRVSVCLIFSSLCSRYRLLLFHCRLGVPKFHCVLTFVSHIIPTNANQSNYRYLPFERVVPLEMTEIWFFICGAKQELRLTSAHRRIWPVAFLFFFLYLWEGVITVYFNSLN